jgi:hypothetical protein
MIPLQWFGVTTKLMQKGAATQSWVGGSETSSSAHPRLLPCRVRSPNLLDGLLGIGAIGAGVAAGIGPIPARPAAVPRRGYHAAAGHLQVAIGIGLLDPLPGIVQPLVAFCLGQNREPGDLVIAPDEDRTSARLALIAAAEVVELDQVGQVFAGPAAGSNTALALDCTF